METVKILKEEQKSSFLLETKDDFNAIRAVLTEDWNDYDSWVDEQFKSLTEGEFSRFIYEQNTGILCTNM